jgi:hypothetical protein
MLSSTPSARQHPGTKCTLRPWIAGPKGVDQVDLWDVGRIVVRRWYVSVPLVLVFFMVAVVMSGRVSPDYSAEASILFVAFGQSSEDLSESTATSDATDTTGPANIYLNFPASLATVAQATGLSVGSDDTRREVAALGLEPAYEVLVEDRSPLLYVRVTSSEDRKAIDTMDHVVSLIETDLDERQDAVDAPADERIEIELLARSEQSSADSGGRGRVRLTVAGLGVLIAVAGAVIFDALVRRRGAGGGGGGGGGGRGSGDPNVPSAPPPDDEIERYLAARSDLGR